MTEIPAGHENISERPLPDPRELMFLSSRSKEAGMAVLPGKKWAIHYPENGQVRAERLQGLLDGKYDPAEVAADLQPDAVLYDAHEVAEQGLEAVNARITDVAAINQNYDYEGFARFVAEMKDRNIDPATAQQLYEGLMQSRIRKKTHDAFGTTGRKQMQTTMQMDAQQTLTRIDQLQGMSRVLDTLKLDWLRSNGTITPEQLEEVVEKLSADEREMYESWKEPYRQFTDKGDKNVFEKLKKQVRERVPKKVIEKNENQTQTAEEFQQTDEELREELEPFKDQVSPPGTAGDPGIPPEDSDEYITPPNSQGESGESQEQDKKRPMFEIIPAGTSSQALTGYYASGRKSYFDIDTKTWSKKKSLSTYTGTVVGDKRQKVFATVRNGITVIPIPNGYAIDTSTIQFTGAQPKILRDQNGCFYVESHSVSAFSVDFLQEDPAFISPPIAEDTVLPYRGSLSADTETAIQSLTGSAREIASQAVDYVHSHHYYPSGGDLEMAQALQYKLRNESTGDNYIQNIDASEPLECYSSNQLFISMMRKKGIPARLVVGHRVQNARQGKAVIDQTTGHAWSEIWDGQKWVRFDATPPTRPQDKKPENQDEQPDGTPSEEADDGGEDKNPQSQPGDESGQGETGEPQDGGEQSGQGGMEQATDNDLQEAQSQMEQAQQTTEQAQNQKKSMDQKIQTTESFEELKKLEEEAEKSEVFDDMKKDLKDKIEAKKQEMKEEIKEKMEQMLDDGFIDEKDKERLEQELEDGNLQKLDRLKGKIDQENQLYNEYQNIKEEIDPLVDEWYKYFAERLPHTDEVGIDEDSLTRQGAFNRHSVMRPRNLLFGTIKNPRVINPSFEPKFIASIMVDVSGSMQGEKLNSARKLLVFYNELFARIGEEFGYIRSSINIFADRVEEIKTYDQDYDSVERYNYSGKIQTVKARLMTAMRVQGGTNMLDAVKKAAQDLNEETFEYPDHASAFYFIGDGEDTCGNSEKVKEFLKINDEEHGFGGHMRSAIMLGTESQRQTLGRIFGDEHTTVAPNFDTLVEQSMLQFDDDISSYLEGKTV